MSLLPHASARRGRRRSSCRRVGGRREAAASAGPDAADSASGAAGWRWIGSSKKSLEVWVGPRPAGAGDGSAAEPGAGRDLAAKDDRKAAQRQGLVPSPRRGAPGGDPAFAGGAAIAARRRSPAREAAIAMIAGAPGRRPAGAPAGS